MVIRCQWVDRCSRHGLGPVPWVAGVELPLSGGCLAPLRINASRLDSPCLAGMPALQRRRAAAQHTAPVPKSVLAPLSHAEQAKPSHVKAKGASNQGKAFPR